MDGPHRHRYPWDKLSPTDRLFIAVAGEVAEELSTGFWEHLEWIFWEDEGVMSLGDWTLSGHGIDGLRFIDRRFMRAVHATSDLLTAEWPTVCRGSTGTVWIH
jgi:hypothetical protein